MPSSWRVPCPRAGLPGIALSSTDQRRAHRWGFTGSVLFSERGFSCPPRPPPRACAATDTTRSPAKPEVRGRRGQLPLHLASPVFRKGSRRGPASAGQCSSPRDETGRGGAVDDHLRVQNREGQTSAPCAMNHPVASSPEPNRSHPITGPCWDLGTGRSLHLLLSPPTVPSACDPPPERWASVPSCHSRISLAVTPWEKQSRSPRQLLPVTRRFVPWYL